MTATRRTKRRLPAVPEDLACDLDRARKGAGLSWPAFLAIVARAAVVWELPRQHEHEGLVAAFSSDGERYYLAAGTVGSGPVPTTGQVWRGKTLLGQFVVQEPSEATADWVCWSDAARAALPEPIAKRLASQLLQKCRAVWP